MDNMKQLAAPNTVPETTQLERRVLAHERILQSLIAYMSRAEPRFLDHLSRTFVEPMEKVHREQDFVETNDYAEEFIRVVSALDDAQRLRDRRALRRLPREKNAGNEASRIPVPERPPERVQTSERNGIWRVTVDGVFRGDYHKREHAETAAALARLGAS